ncbi:ATG18 [Symbiodinium natans]|uniref:ATG18 protein n=1 Tax=Symbiodinium natans TaxID=878477 RepID=A0A812UK47_9DINO|nr:ATG18 [Symbiodinium natans]
MVRAILLLQAAMWMVADHAAAMPTGVPELCQNEVSCQLPAAAGDEMSILQAEVNADFKPEKVAKKLQEKKAKKEKKQQTRKRGLKKFLKHSWKHRLSDA